METARSDRFRERAGTASERGNSKREADDQIEPASDILRRDRFFLFSKSAFLILFRRKFEKRELELELDEIELFESGFSSFETKFFGSKISQKVRR